MNSHTGSLRNVVFLDRDGTINHDSPDYIKNRSEFEFIAGSIEAIRKLTAAQFTVIVITNQSALARKLICLAELHYMHDMMKDAIALNGGRITDIFWCPHMPDSGCDCRKPEPGLILQARHKYNIDLSTAVMVGDSAKDIECARNAGCGRAVLVRTGRKLEADKKMGAKRIFPDHIAENLHDAAEWIISHPHE